MPATALSRLRSFFVTAVSLIAVALLAASGARAADPFGQVTEYSGLTSDAQHLTRGPEGNMWFTERQVPAIGRITPGGQVTIFSAGLRAHSAPCDLVAGPDGNLWFADEGGLGGETGAIGRVTPSGTITEFSTGMHTGDKPQAIIVGPEGDLWWSSFFGRGIGKITTAGVITDLSGSLNQGLDPEYDRTPDGLVAGPDGNIWFANYSEDGSAIGRIAPSTDAVTEFGLPPSAVPSGVTAAADGNVWFVDERNETIDRITPTGVVTPYDAGAIHNSTEEQQPTGITLGPDGNIWFTYSGKSYGTPPPALVGKITPAGVVTTFPLTVQYAGGITPGPDGDLWFLANGVSRITTGGEITKVETPARAVELTTGTDGNMWFDDGEGGETIGKIGTASGAVTGNPGSGGSGSLSTGSTAPAPPEPPPSSKPEVPGVTVGKTASKVKDGMARLPLTFTGGGKLAVSGDGIERLTERIKKAGRTTVAIKPTDKTLSRLKTKSTVKVKIKIAFTPSEGTVQTVVTTLKLEAK